MAMKCGVCGRPLRSDNRSGFCARNPACKAADASRRRGLDPEISKRAVVFNKDHRRIHPLYATWDGMRQRTTNPKNPKYARYGGRGIKVYAPWLKDFPAFERWVMDNLGPRPEGEYPSGAPMFTLDRRDNDGDYEPGNLRWANAKTQANNSTSAVVLSNAAYQELLDENKRLRATVRALRAELTLAA